MRQGVDSVLGWAGSIGCALAVLWLLLGWFMAQGWPFWAYATLAGHAAMAPFAAQLLAWLRPTGGDARDGRIAALAFSPLLLAIVIVATRALLRG